MPHHARAPRLAVVILLCAVPGAAAAAQPARALPKVRVVATGGTIAGEQREPGTLGSYEIKKSVNDIVSLIPNVQRYAEVETEQFSNLPSPSVTPAHWLRLAQRINALLKERPDLAGIVVTHGTARLEETAFFLYLTVKSDRPVVVVGAQRPPTGISPDGPINLLSAIRVAASPQSRGKGVTAVMDDRIISARDVTKIYARGGGFDGAEMGTLGTVATSGVEFFYQPVKKHTVSSDFDVASLETLPRVGISYSYSGAQGVADLDAKAGDCRDHRLRAGRGDVLRGASPQGRDRRGDVSLGRQVDSRSDSARRALPPVVAVKHLMPTKARILMMLALTRTQDPPPSSSCSIRTDAAPLELAGPEPTRATWSCAHGAVCGTRAPSVRAAHTSARYSRQFTALEACTGFAKRPWPVVLVVRPARLLPRPFH
jgi:L-asparaginase